MLGKIHITARRRFGFNLGVGRKAYSTRDIVGPAAAKPSAQSSLFAPQDGEKPSAPPIPNSPRTPEEPAKRKVGRHREPEWLSAPAMARHLGLGKKKFNELFKAGYLPHRVYPPKDTLRFSVRRVEKALAKFDVEAHL